MPDKLATNFQSEEQPQHGQKNIQNCELLNLEVEPVQSDKDDGCLQNIAEAPEEGVDRGLAHVFLRGGKR